MGRLGQRVPSRPSSHLGKDQGHRERLPWLAGQVQVKGLGLSLRINPHREGQAPST